MLGVHFLGRLCLEGLILSFSDNLYGANFGEMDLDDKGFN